MMFKLLCVFACLCEVFCDKEVSPPVREVLSAPYPHQALLGFGKDLQSAKWLAGGTIVNDRFILTAAHTNNYKNRGGLSFVAVDVKNYKDSPSSWQIRKIKKIISHPDYKAPVYYNDIALVEADAPFKFSEDVSPACLPEDNVNNEKVITTTWMDLATKNRRKMADTVQTLHLENFGDEACKTAYAPFINKNGWHGYDETTMMCYGNKSNPELVCKGLSGEPLLVDGQKPNCKYTVVGITSFGAVCDGKTLMPDIYTRVSHYVPWIKNVMRP